MVQYPHSSKCFSQTVGCADAFQRRKCSGTQREKKFGIALTCVQWIPLCAALNVEVFYGASGCPRLLSYVSLKGFPKSTGLCVISGERWKCRYYCKVMSLTLMKIVLVRRRSGVMTLVHSLVLQSKGNMLRCESWGVHVWEVCLFSCNAELAHLVSLSVFEH